MFKCFLEVLRERIEDDGCGEDCEAPAGLLSIKGGNIGCRQGDKIQCRLTDGRVFAFASNGDVRLGFDGATVTVPLPHPLDIDQHYAVQFAEGAVNCFTRRMSISTVRKRSSTP